MVRRMFADGNPDRILGILSVLLGLIGVALAVVSPALSTHPTIYVASGIGLLVLPLAFSSYALTQIFRQNKGPLGHLQRFRNDQGRLGLTQNFIVGANTLHTIVYHLCVRLKAELGEPRCTTELYGIGVKMGNDWAESAQKQYAFDDGMHMAYYKNIEKKDGPALAHIRYWKDWDYYTVLTEFNFELLSDFTGFVTIHKSFLHSSDPNINNMMKTMVSGYVAGAIYGFTGNNVKGTLVEDRNSASSDTFKIRLSL